MIQIYIFGKDNFYNLSKIFLYLIKFSMQRKRFGIFFNRIFWGGFIYFKKIDVNLSYIWWEFIKISIRDQLSLPLVVSEYSYSSLSLKNLKHNVLSVEHLTYRHYHKKNFNIF